MGSSCSSYSNEYDIIMIDGDRTDDSSAARVRYALIHVRPSVCVCVECTAVVLRVDRSSKRYNIIMLKQISRFIIIIIIITLFAELDESFEFKTVSYRGAIRRGGTTVFPRPSRMLKSTPFFTVRRRNVLFFNKKKSLRTPAVLRLLHKTNFICLLF